MATKTITVDDLTGKELADAEVYKHEATYNGDTYTIETTKANAEKLDKAITAYLSGAKTLPDFAQHTGGGSSTGGTKSAGLNYHGLTAAEVRQWAIKNKKKAKSGDPITAKTRRLSQEIYDEAAKVLNK